MSLRDHDLRHFVQTRATLHDPAAGDFPATQSDPEYWVPRCPALPGAIHTTRHSAIYAMHSYHQGKKPHDAIGKYISHFSRPGELVLDPFCGSGGTALAAMLAGRTAIALDRSPAAVFIARNYCAAIDPHELQRAAAELMAAVRPELDWLYATRCDRCDGPARTAYLVYSEQFCCPKCRQTTPLADCPQVFIGTKKTSACPHCLARGDWGGERGAGSRRSVRLPAPCSGLPARVAVPVLAVYRCLGGCVPAEGQRRHDDADAKKRDYFARFDLGKIEEIARGEIPHWRPTIAFPTSFARWQSDLRPAGIQSVADLYTKRNLWALAALRARAAASSCPQTALFALTAVSLAVSRMQRYSPASGFPNMLLVGTYYIPPVGREIEAGSWYEGKLRALVKGYAAIRRAMPPGAPGREGLVTTGDARQLDLPADSIDYIFTDPPYADTVQYGELNFVWESWLGDTPDWHGDEIVVNRARGKDADDWARSLGQAMRECHRVLKPGRWLSLCYHDTSERRWAMLQDLMHDAGFVIDSAAAAGSIETGQKSFNQWISNKATKRDLVISFRKPRPGVPGAPGQKAWGHPRSTDFPAAARQLLCDYLGTHGSATKDRLYDALVSHLICLGQMQAFDFEALLRSVAVEGPREPEHRVPRRGAEKIWKLKK